MDDDRLHGIVKEAIEKIERASLGSVRIQQNRNGRDAKELATLGYRVDDVVRIDVRGDRWRYAAFVLKTSGYIIKVDRDDGMTFFGF